MTKYELLPNDGHKSFCHKAIVEEDDFGVKTLYSYGVPIMKKCPDGLMVRMWDDWSTTTGRHIKAFSGLDRLQYQELEMIY